MGRGLAIAAISALLRRERRAAALLEPGTSSARPFRCPLPSRVRQLQGAAAGRIGESRQVAYNVVAQP